MTQDIEDKIKQFAEADQLAAQIEWKPLVLGGTDFQTHRLLIETNRLTFVSSSEAKSLAFGFLGIGVLLLGIGYLLWNFSFLPLLVGTGFLIFGYLLYQSTNQKTVFDGQKKRFYQGEEDSIDHENEGISFDHIYALQIVPEKLKKKGRKNSKSLRGRFTRYYYSYEINLVLNDGSRVSVIDHGDQNIIRNDALKIAEFLDIPVWDIS